MPAAGVPIATAQNGGEALDALARVMSVLLSGSHARPRLRCIKVRKIGGLWGARMSWGNRSTEVGIVGHLGSA
jgi:hypothetical protein